MNYRKDWETAGRILRRDYPCTLLLLEDRVDEAIERYCRLRIVPASSAARAGRDGWSEFLCSGVVGELDLPPYTADVATYEGAMAELAASDDARRDAHAFANRNAHLPAFSLTDLGARIPVRGRHVRVEHFAFDAPGIVTAIENCDRLEPLESPRPRTILLLKPVDDERPHLLQINSHSERLLSACDGMNSCVVIAGAVGGGGDPNSERSVFEAIESLRVKNILTYRETESVRVSHEPAHTISQ